MGPEAGSRVIEIAKSLIGCHYINGAYGATPGKNDGCPCRPGGVTLAADPNRLNPTRLQDPKKNLAVFAAEMTIKKYCVCAGNYSSFSGGRETSPTAKDLVDYLETLKDKPPATWKNFFGQFTPRRAFGPGPGGDLGGKLVWGQSCKDIRHFDCVGFISYCYWKATGNITQLDIKLWRTPGQAGTVYDLKDKEQPKPGSLMDGDIIVKADHHIAFVSAQGVIYEAQDTDLGVRGEGRFSIGAPGTWTHLVRMPNPKAVPLPPWPQGWWRVWDGKTYYYYFGPDGVVKNIKTVPFNTRSAPPNANNTGRYTVSGSQIVVTWNKVAGAAASTVETFYNATPDCKEMNATSSMYGPLSATRLE